MFPNGCAITADGRTLIVAETFANQLSAFEILDDGSLGSQRVYASTGAYMADGIALDAEGGVWVGTVAEAFVRVLPGEGIVEELPTPGRMAIACALGGPDQRTLFLCTAEGVPAEIPQGKTRGAIEMVTVRVPGVGWP
jgi:sugar lactone lactonase YvrE